MIAILRYNAGNTRSVENAVRQLGYEVMITSDSAILRSATKVIFPGVGEARSAMQYLENNGLDIVIKSLNQPVLGICLGMQLMCAYSEEGDTKALGIFKTRVRRIPAEGIVPHMGWNNFSSVKGALFQNVDTESDCYFVHSYYAEICPDTVAVTDYVLPFSAALQKGNFYGTQFHPEKSAQIGLRILKNFLEL